MFNNKGLPHLTNWSYSGRTSKLPPRSPLPGMTQMSTESESSPPMGKKHMPVPKGDHRVHQRTSSVSSIMEEQPSWLDDLLNEPETPARRINHRRSSSDSIAYMDMPDGFFKLENVSLNEFGASDSASLNYDLQGDTPHLSFSTEHNSIRRSSVRAWESPVNSSGFQSYVPSVSDSPMLANFGSSGFHHGKEWLIAEKQEPEKCDEYDSRGASSERRESLFVKSSASDADQHGPHGKLTSSVKDIFGVLHEGMHFAQRSRVRKLQYIAELERNVSILNAEGSDVAAELAFLKQQHLILSLENKALMQRIGSITHEKQIKDAQYELLRKEVERLRHIYRNQQQEMSKSQQPCGSTNCTISDAADHLDLQFGRLSFSSPSHGDPGSVREPGVMNKGAPYPCMMLQKS
ncbi:uncharacterized protein At4g06598-like [Tasmannia lanceolata]|uniref:uncharacterized protein At4g06598-like n=1 Tax=Tasmannia lanceolata TaxID=3420 RepID=UPI0040646C6D